MIPYGKQNINQNDIEAVIEILKSDFLTQGPSIEKFENAIAKYCGVEYAIAVSNATAALHISCLALGLTKGKILWTSPNSFVASANCGLYCGGEVDFVDIDPYTYNLSISELEIKLEKAKKKGKLPYIIVPVHFSGQSCDMELIYELSKHYGFKIIEDASHAIGGKYKNQPIGNCKFSDLTVFSFHPVKIITTGEGGMITTNNKNLYEKLIRLRSHGITRNPNFMSHDPDGPWYYQQIELGYNYRITDIQAALGWSQLQRLNEFVEKRNQLAIHYNNLLEDLPLTLPKIELFNFSSFHLYVVRLKTLESSKTHKEVFEELRKNGIGVQLHYIPIHTQPYYQEIGFQKGDFPESEKYYREAISLPMYFDLSLNEQIKLTSKIKEILSK